MPGIAKFLNPDGNNLPRRDISGFAKLLSSQGKLQIVALMVGTLLLGCSFKCRGMPQCNACRLWAPPHQNYIFTPFPPFLVTPTQSLIWTTQSCPIHINVDFVESQSIGQWSVVKIWDPTPLEIEFPPTFYVNTYGVPQKKIFRIAAHLHPPPPLAPMVPLVNGHCSTQKKQRYPILKSQRLQKKFAPPGKSTQTALQNIEKGKISHIKKPEASKKVRPSWKKHPKGRYHLRIVDPFCNKSHPKEEISNTCCRPSLAWNKHPKGRYHTRIVDPFCCKSHPKEEISNTCCRPYLDSPPIFSVSMNGQRGAHILLP